ncbi:MAG: ACT domain-containing protein [Deltaproteobacteria bacterium]|nr:ACT domain-containing protein [Deltaproteobacteria bacterium]
MKIFSILFVVGQDRPGIVDDVTSALFESGANLLDSRMATLGGCFSIMVLFSCQEETLTAVKTGIDKLKTLGFEISLHNAHDPEAVARHAEIPLKLEVVAMDHPGIVHKVVRVLRRHGVNIESLNTQVNRAPLSGAPLFDLILEAGVPVGQSISKLKQELATLADEMNLDLNFIR